MVNKLEISISSLGSQLNYVMDFNELTINKNGIIKRVSRGTCFKALSFLTSWDKEYISTNIIDGEEFIVNVYTDSSVDNYHGKGSFPKNYASFKSFIGGL